MTGIDLRPATPEDSELCFQLHKAAMREYVAAIWGWDDHVQHGFHTRAFDPGRWQIITENGTDIGIIVVDHRPNAVYLARLELHPVAQSRGIGGRLLDELVDAARRAGQPVVLDVLVINERAHAFYLRHGFHDVRQHGEDARKIRMSSETSAS
jgi:GNAT superfamily N-acetyltransferase